MTLHELIRNKSLNEIRIRLKNNAEEIFAKEGDMELTPLHVAVQTGDVEIFELLLNTNPDIINIPDAIGDTALHYATIRDDGTYFMRLLCEKGADIDKLNISGATCLYNSIFQVIEDGDNSGLKELRKTKLLLEFGANCHVICFGDTLFDLIAEKKLSMDWWTLLLDYGAAIYTDFSKADVDIDFLRKMTANQIVIGATKDGKPIDRTTPGFEHAHTNEEELRKAIGAGNLYTFKVLISSTKHLLKANSQNSILGTRLTKLIELFETYLVKNMQSLSIEQLLKNSLLAPKLAPNKYNLPPDLREAYETREKQVEQQIIRGGIV